MYVSTRHRVCEKTIKLFPVKLHISSKGEVSFIHITGRKTEIPGQITQKYIYIAVLIFIITLHGAVISTVVGTNEKWRVAADITLRMVQIYHNSWLNNGYEHCVYFI